MYEGLVAAGLSAVTALICLHANEVGNVLGVIDHPDGRRKHHARPTPLTGGLAVLVPFLLLVSFYLVAINFRGPDELMPILPAILIITGGFTVLGYLDDRGGLSPRLRLAAGVVLIGITVLIEPDHLIRTLNFGWFGFTMPDVIALTFTILVVLGLINAVNMADGMNGIVAGSALIWTVCLAFYCPPNILPFTYVLGALLAVVLVFNLSGRLFLGDAGAYGLAGLFSILTIDIYNRTTGLTADIVVAWFIVPVIDCLRLMVSRKLQGGSLLQPDRNHLHHRLAYLLPSRWVTVVYWGMIGIPSVGALIAPDRSLYLIGGVVAVYCAVILRTSARFMVYLRRWRGYRTD